VIQVTRPKGTIKLIGSSKPKNPRQRVMLRTEDQLKEIRVKLNRVMEVLKWNGANSSRRECVKDWPTFYASNHRVFTIDKV
jgi:hypothetical protein